MRQKITLLIVFAGATLTAQVPQSATLQTNRTKATFNSNGAMFTDFQKGQFIAPYAPGEPEISLLRAAGLWLAGWDLAGNLKGAVQLYNTDGKSDFYPGVLDDAGLPVTGSISGIYRVTRAEIEAQLADLADNGVIDNPQPGVMGWPARGNPYFEQYHPDQQYPFFTNRSFAGFYDKDGDGNYNPAYGDYPSIEVRGCPLNRIPSEMLWFAFHDTGIHTESGMSPVQMEVQCQVFAFDCTEESPLRNSVFVRYKLINLATQPIEDLYAGLFNDFTIGNPDDDFFGSDPSRSLVFGYNGDDFDESGYGADIPVLGVEMFRGPIDTFGQEIPMKHVMSFDPATITGPLQFYNLLSGLYPDGTPAPNNGFLYPGNPNDPNADSEVSAGNTPGQRSVVASYGPFTLLPGAVNEMIAGYFYTQGDGQSPLQNVQAMYGRSDEIQAVFDNCFVPANCTQPIVDAPVLPDAGFMRIFPNPAGENLTIEGELGNLQSLRLFDPTGRLVYSRRWSSPQSRISLSVKGFASGMYFVEIGLDNNAVVRKKVVVERH